MTDFFDLAHRQRAHRNFSHEPVADADIERILDAAVHAPSAENKQPWEFVVVRDEDLRERIMDLAEKAWEGGGRDFSAARITEHLLTDVDAGFRGGFRRAPVVIVVAADNERGLEVTAPASIFPAVQNLLLAATALGLGSALTTIQLGFADELSAMLDLPAHVAPLAVIPIGHPAKPLGPPRREPFADHTHRDRFGNPWA